MESVFWSSYSQRKILIINICASSTVELNYPCEIVGFEMEFSISLITREKYKFLISVGVQLLNLIFYMKQEALKWCQFSVALISRAKSKFYH